MIQHLQAQERARFEKARTARRMWKISGYDQTDGDREFYVVARSARVAILLVENKHLDFLIRSVEHVALVDTEETP